MTCYTFKINHQGELMKFYVLIISMLFLGFFGVSNSACSESEDSTVNSDEIDFLVEDDIKYFKNIIRTHDKKILLLKKISSQINSIPKVDATKYTINENEWNNSIKYSNQIKSKNDDTDISVLYDKLISSLSDSIEDMFSILTHSQNEIRKIQRTNDRASDEYRMYDMIRSDVNVDFENTIKNKLNNLDPAYNLIFDRRDFFNDREKEVIKSAVKQNLDTIAIFLKRDKSSVESELKKLLSQFTDEYIENVNISISKRIDLKNDEISQFRSSLKDKLKKLRELQTTETELRSQIDQKLVYAVYAMIGVLLLLFLSLKVLSDDVAKDLIEKRALVEVIGMAFMLLTIIILGTGEKLSREVLGTLLGTISGYIFARGMQKPKNGNE